MFTTQELISMRLEHFQRLVYSSPRELNKLMDGLVMRPFELKEVLELLELNVSCGNFEIIQRSSFLTRLITEGIAGQRIKLNRSLSLMRDQYLNLAYEYTEGTGRTFKVGPHRNFNDPNDGFRKCVEEEIFTVQEFIEIPNLLSKEEQLYLKNPEIRVEIR